MPLSASSNRPLRWPTALVNAPFSWPNSSLSSSVSGSAAQFTATSGPLRLVGRFVDGAGHLLLAGAGLAFDQHRRRGGADIADQFEHRMHARVLAEHVMKRVIRLQLLPQIGHFVLQASLAQGTLDDQAQIVDVDRLGQKVVGAEADRLHGVVDAAEGRHDDDGQRQIAASG